MRLILIMKEKLEKSFSIRNSILQDYDEIKERIVGASNVTGTNLCIWCYNLIASIGLNMTSTAVIIAVMLISPIMGTIQAMGLGVVYNSDLNQAKRAGIGFYFK